MFSESDLVMISALEHYSYCPRQCALIHLEQTFDENIYTLQGRMLHERVDEETSELKGDVRIERAVHLWSRRLGLV
jgi:CRISPR-associated exonuclease Cas4